MHCVTPWSKLGTTWEGVSLDTLLEGMETSAGFAPGHLLRRLHHQPAPGGLTDHQAWIAFRFDDQELEPEHGGPARLLLPQATEMRRWP